MPPSTFAMTTPADEQASLSEQRPDGQPSEQVVRPASEADESPSEFPGGTSSNVAGLRGPTRAWWILAIGVSSVIATSLNMFVSSERGFFLLVLAFVVVSYAAFIDAATRLIPNKLTYPAILIGLGVHLAAGPLAYAGLPAAAIWLGFTPDTVWTAWKAGIGGILFTACIGIISHMARGLGGGDVKLLVALGAMLGFSAVWPVLLNFLLVALILGLINLSLNGGLMARAQVVALNGLMTVGGQQSLRDIYPFSKSEMPFGISLIIALALSTANIYVHEYLFMLLPSGDGS